MEGREKQPDPEVLCRFQVLHLQEDERELDAESTQTESLRDLHEVEEILGYEFKNKSLLEEAFTHSSFSEDCFSYERLEYVGDAVLNLLFTKEQYFLYPDLQPGPLTRLRAANVDTEKLARAAIKHGLHRYLRHKKPLLHDQIHKFTLGISEYPLHSNGLIDAPKALADIVESSIGAVFIDSNSSIDTAWEVFKGLLEPIINPVTIGRHPVTELYEVCQKRNLKLKFVDLWEETTAFDVIIDDQHMGRGVYGLKKDIAHNRAAKNALENIRRLLLEKEIISPRS
ncbi:Ribonuclease 3-like protein 3 [Morella rubra]|uniref:Ribonuclease 3-like protein 3 n=1 Tax=Morella rubra TaxID=262757 RepID=A0A6A1UL56_9ROSI|nr:Ribonuclease 3-like protein 3 [Morella rubra]